MTDFKERERKTTAFNQNEIENIIFVIYIVVVAALLKNSLFSKLHICVLLN